ncbi:conserved hypothetical protein [Bathymodiolus platifrons methanotrophic gill symbiont]|uniref:hypothetical protein n=1 Tax=Bathymodiolus platifrons methanotrophic gill symbiont TaxID=113268 RepID=UPI000B4087C4|nr:hypothetical protein [Bathymodiolus platifrons methanotrophic gill symbiont]GAW87872.1 conserved hypothetical protein [Bathymodiolus platifrons methanotrophic gill symbiont]GFO76804.1 hypothetical protein BPLS_P4819 [Bathymodiolus platifrons methanotrophic gill symbiont]
MAKKSFQKAPKPQNHVSQADIEAFEKGGVGKDKTTHPHKPTFMGDKKEPLKRLSIDLPESTHKRFKVACTATSHKMTKEIEKFILEKTIEFEKEAGIIR